MAADRSTVETDRPFVARMTTPEDDPAAFARAVVALDRGELVAVPTETVYGLAADAANPDAPKTVFGLILAGLRRRRAAGLISFTVMSCDNIPGNGHVTENAVAGLAAKIDPELADWVRPRIARTKG